MTKIMMSHFTISIGKLAITRASNIYATSADIRKNTQAHYWYVSFIQILFIIFLFLINVSQLASKFMLNFDYIENIKKFLTFDSINGILIFK